ncbi:hypothetical protein LCGC14_3015700 [marine sediment metagenome]|uniref:Uncharacterized protein n=1 Tax=marine sediment metagenome TaxID=412755 RepID=A0A0F8WWP8_9ZZZZ
MTQQLTLDEGLRLRDAGIASLERHPWLERARRAAVRLCELQEWVTSDDVQDAMRDDPAPHVNAWGALFHDRRFQSTGRTIKTKRRQGHYRDIKVWRLA